MQELAHRQQIRYHRAGRSKLRPARRFSPARSECAAGSGDAVARHVRAPAARAVAVPCAGQ
jgi:hypothetical protein